MVNNQGWNWNAPLCGSRYLRRATLLKFLKPDHETMALAAREDQSSLVGARYLAANCVLKVSVLDSITDALLD
jgi:hypothetical protein